MREPSVRRPGQLLEDRPARRVGEGLEDVIGIEPASRRNHNQMVMGCQEKDNTISIVALWESTPSICAGQIMI